MAKVIREVIGVSAENSRLSPAASELNNLLHIISGTTALIENIWEGKENADQYFEMLRSSVERAVKITSQLAASAGGSEHKSIVSQTAPSAPGGRSPGRDGCRILVTDDEPMTLDLFRQLLTPAGFEVTCVGSARQCLDCFRRDPRAFDIVLLDFAMPEMNGEETFTLLHQLAPDLVVSMTTGFVSQTRIDRLLAAGLAGYLRKPFSGDELVAHIHALLDRQEMPQQGLAADVAAAV